MTADQPELALTGMPKRLFVASPTRLTTFSDCPRRYRMNYLERPTPPPGPPWAHLSFGSSVHQALRGWYDLPSGGRTAAAAGALVRRGWITEGYRDPEQSDVYRERAAAMVESYAAGLDPTDEPAGGERTDRPARRAGRAGRTPGAGGRRLQDRARAAHDRRRPGVPRTGAVRRGV